MPSGSGRKRPLTRAQIKKIKAYLVSKNNLRDIALFHLSIDSMFRSGDILKLTVKDVLRIDGKVLDRLSVSPAGLKGSSVVPLQRDTVDALTAWIRVSDKGLNDFIFTGRKRTGSYISHAQHTRLVKQWVGAIGLNRRYYSTHSLRRTKASIIYAKTKDLEICRKLLGLRSISATRNYLGLETKEPLEVSASIQL